MADSTELVNRAIDLSDSEDYAGALQLLTQAILADPNNAQAYFERGMALLNLAQDAEAIPDFDQALAINPEFPGARKWRANALAALGNHQQAAEERLATLRANPEGSHQGMGVNPQVWADCATAFISAGNSLKARELLTEYFESYAQSVTKYIRYETAPMRLMAKLLIQSGELTRACEFAERAYASAHQRPADLLAYALALESSGNLDAARLVCTKAMEVNDQMPGIQALQERLSA